MDSFFIAVLSLLGDWGGGRICSIILILVRFSIPKNISVEGEFLRTFEDLSSKIIFFEYFIALKIPNY